MLLVLGVAFLSGCANNRFGQYKPDQKKATARPYTIKGVKYYPQKNFEYDEVGHASFYGDGDGFHGKKTATGELFHANGLTAAHKTLPLPSVVEVTNLSNGKSIKLKVNDRGPFVKGRIIDVSTAAAKELGFYKNGITKVRVRTLVSETKSVHGSVAKKTTPAKNRTNYGMRPSSSRGAVLINAKASTPNSSPNKTIKQQSSNKQEYYIQAGVFNADVKAQALKNKLQQDIRTSSVHIQKHPNKSLQRVKVGPFLSIQQAQDNLNILKACGHKECYILKKQTS